MRFKRFGDVEADQVDGATATRERDYAPELNRLIVPSVDGARVGHCPDCGFLLTRRELLIEYDESTDSQRLYAECQFCDTTLRFR